MVAKVSPPGLKWNVGTKQSRLGARPRRWGLAPADALENAAAAAAAKTIALHFKALSPQPPRPFGLPPLADGNDALVRRFPQASIRSFCV